MVLPDTSIWVDYLRGRDSELQAAIDSKEIVTCGPVVAELLAGTGSRDRAVVGAALDKVPWAELRRDSWSRVGAVAAALRERGGTVPLTDIEIAVAAVEAGAELWTRDSDFDRVRTALPDLRVRPV